MSYLLALKFTFLFYRSKLLGRFAPILFWYIGIFLENDFWTPPPSPASQIAQKEPNLNVSFRIFT